MFCKIKRHIPDSSSHSSSVATALNRGGLGLGTGQKLGICERLGIDRAVGNSTSRRNRASMICELTNTCLSDVAGNNSEQNNQGSYAVSAHAYVILRGLGTLACVSLCLGRLRQDYTMEPGFLAHAQGSSGARGGGTTPSWPAGLVPQALRSP